MFYYLGRKKALARLYPEPRYDTLVEPFGASGAYSLHGDHWQKRVILCDLNPMVCAVWRYLLAATPAQILALPRPEKGERLSAIESLSPEERWLIAQHINPGSDQRSDVVTAYTRWPAGQRYIAANLHKVKHWTVREGEYKEQLADLDGVEATWFVDPPYEGIPYYRTNTVVYPELATWCLARRGQLIVCEREGATWLPFTHLKTIAICGKGVSKETVYLRDDHIRTYPWEIEP